MLWAMFMGKPVIGIVGGIGSGKSHVARILGELGCKVIDSDEQVKRAYRMPQVVQELRKWWGDGVFGPDGQVNRRAIAARVFSDPRQRRKLEQLIHPVVHELRAREMAAAANEAGTAAYVWDTPLLVETGLDKECDAVIYVEATEQERVERVMANRGWDEREWQRREKIQMPLDIKRKIAKDIVRNTAGADDLRNQVREVLSRIVAGKVDSGR